ncbi:hypothetical protein [Algibacter sp. L1A34]|nr:hypothetical protein [Algibacter sp. L1A34]
MLQTATGDAVNDAAKATGEAVNKTVDAAGEKLLDKAADAVKAEADKLKH